MRNTSRRRRRRASCHTKVSSTSFSAAERGTLVKRAKEGRVDACKIVRLCALARTMSKKEKMYASFSSSLVSLFLSRFHFPPPPHSPIFLSFLSFFSSVRHYFSFTIAFFVPVFFPPSHYFPSFFHPLFLSVIRAFLFFFYLLFFFLSSIQFLSVLVLSVAHRSFPLHFVPVPVSLFAPSFN